MSVYWVAAAWMALALAASLIRIRRDVAVALVEIVLAVLLSNLPGHCSFIVQTVQEALDDEDDLPPHFRHHPHSSQPGSPSQDGAQGVASRVVPGGNDDDG